MPDAEGLKDLTGAQYGLIGSVMVAIGAGLTKLFTFIAASMKSKEERLTKLESDRFQLILDEWRADRAASTDQQKLNAIALKENTVATAALAETVKNLSTEIKRFTDSK